ncbi:MAG TPA: DUF4846 domain-containing protein, partial [Adhaeribacter sp.]|nr:DUF4846 domain-containing protein [Adhaeribacter sp.]
MKHRTILFIPIFLFFSGCNPVESKQSDNSKTSKTVGEFAPLEESVRTLIWENISPSGKTLEARLPVPPGFQRLVVKPNSIGNYFRNLPLKPDGSQVLLYNGREKNNQEAQIAVIDMEIGKRNL